MRRHLLLLFFSSLWTALGAQGFVAPVNITSSIDVAESGEATLTFQADIAEGWHLYSTEAMNGPTQASLTLETVKGARLKGPLRPAFAAQKQYEEMFGSEVFFFEQHAVFLQTVELTGGPYELTGYLTYGACNNVSCTPPTDEEFSFKGDFTAKKQTEEPAQQPDATDALTAPDSLPSPPSAVAMADSISITPLPLQQQSEGHPLLWLFLLGFAGGLVALFTPCVWPVIPLTVSFFLKRGAGGRKGVQAALLYGAAIIIIYVSLGLAVTAAFGASALNDLATNAFFNILFFLMLVLFGVSFIGGFDLTLPSSWAGSVDSKANRTTGFLSIFLMAFTLVLVSFSCTGPIIGFLLVEVVTADIAGPVVGMLGFSLALALPFTLFALFPGWLKAAPKSGSWMHTVKVTLGYVELAFSLKFLSVADMAYGWGILPRWLFIALWIALALALTLQLLFTQEGARPLRYSIAALALAFAGYMAPGLWGAPLHAVSAFTPPLEETGRVIDDFEAGLALAKREGKRVFVDFTGYGCVNCRKMEATVFQDKRIRQVLERDYVFVRLYVDDKTALAEPLRVEQNGKQRTLHTVGDRWSFLQATRFGAQTQPFYVLLDADGNPLAPARSYDEDADAFLRWLQSGESSFTVLKQPQK